MPSISEVLAKHAEHGDLGLLPAVEEYVRHGHLAEYLFGLTRYHLLTDEPVIGYRHPNGFSKIRLARLPHIDWTVRLHLWDPDAADSDIHNHRWNFASYVVAGSIFESRYESAAGSGQAVVYDCSPSHNGSYELTNEQACNVELISEEMYSRDHSYQHDAAILHKAKATADAPAVTLFIQGPEVKASTTVIKQRAIGNTSFPTSWFAASEVLDELRAVAYLIGDA